VLQSANQLFLGSGIAPFLPIPPEPKGIYLPFHSFLCVCRVPLLLFFSIAYFAFFQFLPFGVLGRKASLWCILGIPGIWWIDLQIDGVKKGYARASYFIYTRWDGENADKMCLDLWLSTLRAFPKLALSSHHPATPQSIRSTLLPSSTLSSRPLTQVLALCNLSIYFKLQFAPSRHLLPNYILHQMLSLSIYLHI